jgi:hypothetical protein
MNVITQLSRYFFIILMLFFTVEDYLYFGKGSDEARDRLISRQIIITHVFAVHFQLQNAVGAAVVLTEKAFRKLEVLAVISQNDRFIPHHE